MRAASSHLSPLLDWPDWETQNKIAAVDRLAARGGASIVTVGSSIVNAGMDPVALTKALGDDRPVFNAALNGSNVPSTRLWTMQVVVPRLRPRVVVIGIDGVELNGGGRGERRFLNLLRGSKGWRELIGSGSLYERISDRASDWSYLVRYRSMLRKPTSLFKVDTGPVEQHVESLGTFRPGIRTERPDALRKHRFRTFDKDLLNGSPVGRNRLATLGRFVDELTARGIRVVLVRMPTVDEIGLDANKPGPYGRIEATMNTFVATHRLRYVDLRPSFTDIALYSDVHHVNLAGKRRVSEILTPILRSLVS